MALTKIDDRGLTTPNDLLDNEKIRFGTGNDLEVYFDGTHSKIVHTPGSGNAYLATDSLILSNAAMSEYYLTGTANGAVELYYDNVWKLATSSLGLNINGHILPATTQNRDLGSSSYRWDYIYADHALDTSDRNLKNTIQATDLGLSFVNKLNPVSYKLNGKDKTHYGLVAQEVEEVITEEGKTLDDFGAIVHKEEIYSLAYNEFISPLIKAIQELTTKVETLETKVAALEAK